MKLNQREAETYIKTQKNSPSSLIERLKAWVKKLHNETYALYFAARDPRVPWYAKALAAFVVAHTFSPIDLIPDFIPVLGFLDDLIITPVGLWLAIRMIPPEVMQDARRQAAEQLLNGKIISKAGLVMVIAIWLLLAGAAIWLLSRWF